MMRTSGFCALMIAQCTIAHAFKRSRSAYVHVPSAQDLSLAVLKHVRCTRFKSTSQKGNEELLMC